MGTPRRNLLLLQFAAVVALLPLFVTALRGTEDNRLVQIAAGEPRSTAVNTVTRHTWSITSVSSPSALHRLGLTIQQTSMGSTGQWGPAPDAVVQPADSLASIGDLTRPVTLAGADLFRFDCQGCHKKDGSGAPPEINSLIEPVRGTSLVLWEQRMKQAGRSVDPVFARQVVSGAKADLLKRLQQGGQKMPPFTHLQGAEVEALLAYLDLLAGIPGAATRQRTAVESSMRVGEHLVKGTCHICHDATGSWPSLEALLDNAVPSLASLTTHRTLTETIQKVRHGAPVVMGIARMPYRGRMPVFDYLSDGEVAAAYLYLIAYPPR